MKKLWAGLVLAIVAFVSYFFFFLRFPITRDVPWVPVILFLVTFVLLFAGLRSVFAGGTRLRKIAASALTLASLGIVAFFCLTVFEGRNLPASKGAPAVGQKVPDFTLPDVNRHPVSLAKLLTAPGTKGVLLVFYRGYW